MGMNNFNANQRGIENHLPDMNMATDTPVQGLHQDKSWLDFLSGLNWGSNNQIKDSLKINEVDASRNSFYINDSLKTFNSDYLNSDSEKYNIMNSMIKNKFTTDDNSQVFNDFLMHNLLELSGNFQLNTNKAELNATAKSKGKRKTTKGKGKTSA